MLDHLRDSEGYARPCLAPQLEELRACPSLPVYPECITTIVEDSLRPGRDLQPSGS